MAPSRIVYVSCDSATLARDLKILCEKDYRLTRVRGVDQFCHSVHVETVVLLSHKKADSYIHIDVEFGEDVYKRQKYNSSSSFGGISTT